MTISSAEVRRNAFTDDLKDDWIAVNAAGTPIGRAGDEASVRRANPDAAGYFSGRQLEGHIATADIPAAALTPAAEALERIRREAEPQTAPPAAPPKGNPAVGMPDHSRDRSPVSKAPQAAPVADGTAFDHDNSGAVGGSKKGEESTAHKGAVKRRSK